VVKESKPPILSEEVSAAEVYFEDYTDVDWEEDLDNILDSTRNVGDDWEVLDSGEV
jgi:hypothetical protein